jgi:beta-lactamase regulating signal transducer with metallopeptidase domain/ankyrin repeat protein
MTFLFICSLQIAVILLMALLAQPFLRKKSAAARHWVLSVAVVFSAIIPLLNVVMPSWSVREAITRHPAIVPIQRQLSAITLPAAPSAESAGIAEKSNMLLVHSAWADTPRLFVAAVWSGGMLVGLMVLITGLVRLVRVAAASSAVQGGPWIELAEQISKEYRLRLPVRLLMSRNSSILITFGVVRPKVILPAGSVEWPVDRARIVLRHELAHVRRSDWLVQMIAQCLRVVYWFNPLVWIVWNRLRLESECACDDAVIADGSEAHEYAAHLLHLARTLNRTDRAWSAAMTMSRPSTIERRFSAMLNPVLNRHPVTRKIIFVTILIGLAVTLPLTIVSKAKEVRPEPIMEGPALPPPTTTERSEAASQPTPQPKTQPVPPSAPQPEPQQLSEQPTRLQNQRGVQEHYQSPQAQIRATDRALYEAADQGDLSEIENLLRAGANVNSVIRGDGTPLIAAARHGRLDMVTALLDRGADPNVPVPGDGSALIAAAAGGHLDIVRALLDRGADINMAVTGDGSPLIAAAGRGRIEVINLLLGRGANIEQGVPGDENALTTASAYGQLPAVQLLVSRGADVNARFWVERGNFSSQGEWRTPLSMARQAGHQDVVAYLLSVGARD